MKNKIDISFINKLRTDGINFKGFGIIPKSVMTASALSLEAKAIYSYFCSYAGNGNTAFPSVSKVTKDLSIGKNTYYKYLKQLVDMKYIRISRTKGKLGIFSHNVYTLLKPKENGYGTIPKSLMLDDRLDIKSKAIYAYFSSFAGTTGKAFPSISKILFDLGISKTTYYRYFNELITINYIRAEQRHINGKLSINDYYLVSTPKIEKAKQKYTRTVSSILKTQCPRNEDTVNEDMVNRDTNINLFNKNKLFNKINLSDKQNGYDDIFSFLSKSYDTTVASQFNAVISSCKLDLSTFTKDSYKSLVERFKAVSNNIDNWYAYILKMIKNELLSPTITQERETTYNLSDFEKLDLFYQA